MKCPVCGFDNRPGLRFCTECGKPLAEALPEQPLVCGACGHGNRPGVPFCEECGALLAGVLPEEMAEPVPPTLPEQVCAACGHANRPGVRFCEECGESLVTIAPVTPPRPPSALRRRRFGLVGLALALLLFATPLVCVGTLFVTGMIAPAPGPWVSEQEAVQAAEALMRDNAPWMAEVEPAVQVTEFAGDKGYIITYQHEVEAQVEDGTPTFRQMFVVSINAVTGKISVAESP